MSPFLKKMAVERLVPHRPPMLLVVEVREASEDEVTCVGRVPTDHPLAGEDGAPAVLGVELAAQSAACHEGIRLRGHGGDPASDDAGGGGATHGYLVSISRSRFRASFLPVDEDLVARVRLVRTMGPLASYAGVVCRAARPRRPVVTCRFLVRGPRTD